MGRRVGDEGDSGRRSENKEVFGRSVWDTLTISEVAA
jgi:hypothetical protein